MLIFSLLLGITIAFIIIGKTKMGTYNNPLTVYLLFWSVFLSISMLDPFNLYSVSDESYLLLLLNVFLFSVGYVTFCKRLLFGIHKVRDSKKHHKYIFIILNIFLTFVLIYYLEKYNQLISGLDVAYAREIKYETGQLFSSHSEYAFFNYFVDGFVYLSTLYSMCYYVFYKKIDFLFILAIINIILFSHIGLGRFILFDALIIFIFANIFNRSAFNKTNIMFEYSNKKIVLLLFIIIVCGFVSGMVFITSARVGVQLSTVQDYYDLLIFTYHQAIVYFLGPFRAFDNFINERIYNVIGYTFGRATFSGIEEIISNIFLLFGIKWISANSIMADFTVRVISIGEGHFFNAFYTGVMNYYLDGGVLGVIALSFSYGSIAAGLSNYYNKHQNIFSYALLVYFTYTTIASEFRLSFMTPSTWMIIIVLAICSLNVSSMVNCLVNER